MDHYWPSRLGIIMPNDVKAVVSVIVAVVAMVLAWWGSSPIRPDLGWFVIATAAFMIIAMWIFPEAGVKKGDIKKGDRA